MHENKKVALSCIRRDYVTGFRKRKQKRRKEALKSLERIQRDQKLEERAEVSVKFWVIVQRCFSLLFLFIKHC